MHSFCVVVFASLHSFVVLLHCCVCFLICCFPQMYSYAILERNPRTHPLVYLSFSLSILPIYVRLSFSRNVSYTISIFYTLKVVRNSFVCRIVSLAMYTAQLAGRSVDLPKKTPFTEQNKQTNISFYCTTNPTRDTISFSHMFFVVLLTTSLRDEVKELIKRKRFPGFGFFLSSLFFINYLSDLPSPFRFGFITFTYIFISHSSRTFYCHRPLPVCNSSAFPHTHRNNYYIWMHSRTYSRKNVTIRNFLSLLSYIRAT